MKRYIIFFYHLKLICKRFGAISARNNGSSRNIGTQLQDVAGAEIVKKKTPKYSSKMNLAF